MHLGTTDFTVGYQTVSSIAQVAAGLCFERHSHPGIESGYVFEGDLLVKSQGRPDQVLNAGDPMQIPAGVPHTGCTTGGLKVFTVHVVEKGKPFATLLPQASLSPRPASGKQMPPLKHPWRKNRDHV
jgi:hypothetical protein